VKIKIDIDCTPAEARAFLGLPDVGPLQAEILAALRERMTKSLETMDPEKLMKLWLGGGAQGLEQWQKAFWEQFAGGRGKGRQA
jgi:hypothetical protein